MVNSDEFTPEAREKWLSDANNMASVNGYALYIQKQFSSNWSAEHERLFKMLKTKCEIKIGAECKRIAEEKNWNELEMRAHEAEALFSFNETFSGVRHRIEHMIELTGIRPEEAPDFFAERGLYKSSRVNKPDPKPAKRKRAPSLSGSYTCGRGKVTITLATEYIGGLRGTGFV